VAILGLISARGGSKGIPRKNVLPIAGKPLIAWTIEAALAAKTLDRVVVTTDSPEIAEIATAHGAEVPFLRPADLALDETPGIEPVLHALDLLPDFGAVVLLQPTSPLRNASDIDAAVALADGGGGVNVVGVTEAAHAGWTFSTDGAGMLDIDAATLATRRQELPKQFTINGAVYVAQTDRLRAHRSFVTVGTLGYLMPAERSVDIDTPLDWRIAEMLLKGDA
jgi:CMP-N-acetylneuraminic acid synthetase